MQLMVLGMHRCGTSMVARMVHGFGISVGGDKATEFASASDENPGGFWEHQGVVATNTALLSARSSDWDRVLNWPESALPKPALADFKLGAGQIIADLDCNQPWVIKDPRLCVTGDYWLQLLEKPVIVWSIRSPIEAAISLQQRNNFPLDVGLALWEFYNLSAARLMADRPYTVVDYSSVIADPEVQLDQLWNWLADHCPKPKRLNRKATLEFINPQFHRSKAPEALASKLASTDHPAFDIYQQILAGKAAAKIGSLALSKTSQEVLERHEKVWRRSLNRISRKFGFAAQQPSPEYDSVAGSWLVLKARSENLELRLENARQQYGEVTAELQICRSELSRNEKEADRCQAELEHLRASMEENSALTQRVALMERQYSQAENLLNQTNQRLAGENQQQAHEIEKCLARVRKLSHKLELSKNHAQTQRAKLEEIDGHRKAAINELSKSERALNRASQQLALDMPEIFGADTVGSDGTASSQAIIGHLFSGVKQLKKIHASTSKTLTADLAQTRTQRDTALAQEEKTRRQRDQAVEQQDRTRQQRDQAVAQLEAIKSQLSDAMNQANGGSAADGLSTGSLPDQLQQFLSQQMETLSQLEDRCGSAARQTLMLQQELSRSTDEMAVVRQQLAEHILVNDDRVRKMAHEIQQMRSQQAKSAQQLLDNQTQISGLAGANSVNEHRVSELKATVKHFLRSQTLLEAHGQQLADRQQQLESDYSAKLSKLQAIEASYEKILQSARWRLGNMAISAIETMTFRRPAKLTSAYVSESLRHVTGSMEQTMKSKVGKPLAAKVPKPLPSKDSDKSWAEIRKIVKSVYSSLYPQWEQENHLANEQYGQFREAVSETPKVMVGTLSSGENEFASSKKSVGRQSYPAIEHVVIEGLAKKEAHARLFGGFLKSDCEYLVKLDADMVILDPDFVAQVVRSLRSNPGVSQLQMAILDYYSGGEIQGINAYTKDMQWAADAQHELFTDATQTAKQKRLIIWGGTTRKVLHSPNPTSFQAFHFGVHRALKVVSALDSDQMQRAEEQMLYLERTFNHYLSRRSDNLLAACLGAEYGLRSQFSVDELNYANPTMHTFYSELATQSKLDRDILLGELRQQALGAKLDELRGRREVVALRSRVNSLLMIIPHFKLFGGVNRFLEICGHARSQGIDAWVAAPTLSSEQLKRVQEEFPKVKTCTIADALTRDWDVAICGDFSSGLMSILPWISSAMSAVYLLNGWQHRHLNNAQIRIAQPDTVIANSSYCASHYPEWMPAVIAGGVNSSLFHPQSQPVKSDNSLARLCVPGGRKKPRKRFEDAVAACLDLYQQGMEIELHILDAGGFDLSVPFPVIFHSGLNRSEVAELFRSMDIIVCPEEDAGWNNPAAEALACGIPLVCTEAGTSDFAVDGVNAWVVPPRSPQALANALKEILDDPEKAKARAMAGCEAVTAFSWESLTRRLIDHLESCRHDHATRTARNKKSRRQLLKLLDEVEQ